MTKRKAAVFLLFCFILMTAFPVIASAETGAYDQCLSQGIGCEVVGQSTKDALQAAKDEAGLMEGFLIGRVQDLFQIGGINSIANLVFGNPYKVWTDNPDSQQVYYNLFYEKELKTFIKPLLTMFASCFVGFVALSIMIAALKLGLRAYSPQAKGDFWTDVQMWIVAAFFMGTFTWFVEALFGLNEGITQTVKYIAETQMGVKVTDMSIIAFAEADNLFDDPVALLGNLLVMLGEWVLALYLNIIYIARKIIIILLMIMAPVAAISLLYAKTRSFFGSWLKELAGNIFLQSIHAIVLGVFAGMSSLGAGMIFKLGMLIMFIPITGMVSKWLNLGDSSSAVGRAATMGGLAGLGGAIMLAKGARGVMANRGGGSGSQSSGGAGVENTANDGSTTGLTAAASGANSSKWQKLRSFTAGVGGVAGAVAGLPLGGAGVAVGGFIGSKLGSALPQIARNTGASLGNIGTTLTDPVRSQGDGTGKSALSGQNWKQGYSEMFNNLAERRKFAGRVGESIGGLVGLGGVGRSMGHMFSGASRNRIMSEQFENKTLEDHMREDPGAMVQWRQTNEGSAYYKQQGNEWKQITPYGAADPKLVNGEVRKMDYQLNDGTNWTRQENGTFTAPAAPVSFAGSSSSSVGKSIPSFAGPSSSSVGQSIPSVPSASGGSAAPIYGSNGQVLSTVAPSRPPIASGTGSSGPSHVASGTAPSSTATTGPTPVSIPAPTTVGNGATPSSTTTTGPTPVSTPAPTPMVAASGTTTAGNGAGPREIVGLSGSTSHLARTSGVYIQGADGKKYEDTRMNAKDINPDSYFAHNVAGAPNRRSLGDKGADFLHGTGRKAQQVQTNFRSWHDSYFQQRNAANNRHRGIV